MRAALGTQTKNGNFIYSLEKETFSWKRRLSNNFIAKLGQIKLKKVPVLEAYESILDKSLDVLCLLQENVVKLNRENCSLRKERDVALGQVIEFATVKTEWEKKLYGQFVAVLNAKKERIIALEEMLDVQIADPSDTRGSSSKEGEEEKMEAEVEDPYAGDTDVDSDIGDAAADDDDEPTTSASSTLQRRRNFFPSFDSSPGSPSPVPMLPKRSRLTTKAASAASSSSTSSSTSARNVFRDARQDDGDEEAAAVVVEDAASSEDMALGENTQDLLDQI